MKMVNDWHDSPEFQSQAQTALGILKKIGIVFWNSVIQITQEFFHRLFQNSWKGDLVRGVRVHAPFRPIVRELSDPRMRKAWRITRFLSHNERIFRRDIFFGARGRWIHTLPFAQKITARRVPLDRSAVSLANRDLVLQKMAPESGIVYEEKHQNPSHSNPENRLDPAFHRNLLLIEMPCPCRFLGNLRQGTEALPRKNRLRCP